MKQGNITHWIDKKGCKNLLLFAQLVDELLFDYSIPSNRISTLNSHYLCLDALSTINTISQNGVPEGTLKPILEELYRSLDTDIVFKLSGENPMRYFVKYNNGKYIKAKPNDLNYDESKRIIIALYEKYFEDNWYILAIAQKIKELVISNSADDWQNLFRLTKTFLTEIVNSGYSSRFIFEKLHYFFFTKKNIVSTPNIINDFFEVFDFEEKEYTVILKTLTDNTVFLKNVPIVKILNEFTPRTTLKREKTYLSKNESESFITVVRKAVDPYTAIKKAKIFIERQIAFYKLFEHNSTFSIKNLKWGVYDTENIFMTIEDDKSAVHKTKSLSKTEIAAKLKVLQSAINLNLKRENLKDIRSLFNAISFHSLSIESVSEENQLLDMWAIFESLLNIDNRSSDRISQICVSLSPVLKRKYLYSLFLQLAQDIKNYSKIQYQEITGSLDINFENVSKICEFVLLDSYKNERDTFLQASTDFPLLIERIHYYNSMLATTTDVYHFIEKHSERVRWQIMRIYRNRNLIIHNGDSMPYLKLLVENLHAYIDDFLDYTIQASADKWTIESMYQEAIVQESAWLDLFGGKKEKISSIHIEQMLKACN